MFEKEAEEYVNANKVCLVDIDDKGMLEEAYKDGAEFGYNKANKWHYVKDGLPISDKDKYYFVVDKWNEPMIARFYCGKWFNHSVIDDVIAWKEIVLPELKGGITMFYKFKCKSCGKTFEVEIPIKAYDAEKGKQTCPACNGKMERVIEWCGMAESTNKNGWFGKSDGSNAI